MKRPSCKLCPGHRWVLISWPFCHNQTFSHRASRFLDLHVHTFVSKKKYRSKFSFKKIGLQKKKRRFSRFSEIFRFPEIFRKFCNSFLMKNLGKPENLGKSRTFSIFFFEVQKFLKNFVIDIFYFLFETKV